MFTTRKFGEIEKICKNKLFLNLKFKSFFNKEFNLFKNFNNKLTQLRMINNSKKFNFSISNAPRKNNTFKKQKKFSNKFPEIKTINYNFDKLAEDSQAVIKSNEKFQKNSENFIETLHEIENFDIEKLTERIEEDYPNEKNLNDNSKSRKKTTRVTYDNKDLKERYNFEAITYMKYFNQILKQTINETNSNNSYYILKISELQYKINDNFNMDENWDKEDLLENERFDFSNIESDKYNEMIVFDYNKINNTEIFEKNSKNLDKNINQLYYNMIDSIPRTEKTSFYCIDVMKLFEIKKIKDINILIYFLEKNLDIVLKMPLFDLCDFLKILFNLEVIQTFYVQNVREINLIDYSMKKFLDEFFINKIINRSILKEGFYLHNKDYENGVKFNSDNENDVTKFERKIRIKNKMIETYVRNELNEDPQELFDIDYIFNGEELFKIHEKIINKKKGKSEEKELSATDDIPITILDYFKNKDEILEKIGKNKENLQSKSDKEEFKYNHVVKINDKYESNHDLTNNDENFIKTFENYLRELQEKYFSILKICGNISDENFKSEKAIIVIKLLKIIFLKRFFSNISRVKSSKILNILIFTYRIMFINKVDKFILEIFLKKKIKLFPTFSLIQSFNFAKNFSCILRKLSSEKKNCDFTSKNSEALYVIYKIFENFNPKFLRLLSFREIGNLLYMIGQKNYLSDNSIFILNNYIFDEIGKYVIRENMNQYSSKFFFQFLDLILLGYTSDLTKYNYLKADELIIKFLSSISFLPSSELFSLHIKLQKLNHQNKVVWFLIYKHLIEGLCSKNNETQVNVLSSFKYIFYVKKYGFFFELNKTFFEFLIDRLANYLVKKNKINHLYDVKDDPDKEEFYELNEDVVIDELRDLNYKNSSDPEKLTRETQCNYINLQNLSIYVRSIIDEIQNGKFEINERIFEIRYDDCINAIKFVMNEAQKFNFIKDNFVEFGTYLKIFNVIIKFVPKEQLSFQNYLYFSEFTESMKEISKDDYKKIKEILKLIEFSSIPNFPIFLKEEIFSDDETLQNKLANFIEENCQPVLRDVDDLEETKKINTRYFDFFLESVERLNMKEKYKEFIENIKIRIEIGK